MDVNEAANLRNLKTTYDAIVFAISATCSEWGLLPIDVRVIVSPTVFGKLLMLIGYPGVFFEPKEDGYIIGIADTELIVETKHHFVKGEVPFKIMAI
jgi:hypothetical protein